MARGYDPNLLPPAPDFYFEARLWGNGYRVVAGIDEAGRGALAGPVAVGALVFPPDLDLQVELKGVNDSKLLAPEQRSYWAVRIQDVALAWQVGFSQAGEIDEYGIVPAVRLAAGRALAGLNVAPEILITDYLELPDCPLPQISLVKGDARSLSVAAASILAKTARDALLCDLEAGYPGYGFARHKGYGTAAHRAALERLGPSRLHRRSFEPLRSLTPARAETEFAAPQLS
ncbi:MAG TPA: ribonuclease HII [Anaerolineales bacterium]|nr:ribonuclease HII [Anaerolineales bacterium]